jgi:ribosomal protein S18 acetylase RimI-like enzyme
LGCYLPSWQIERGGQLKTAKNIKTDSVVVVIVPANSKDAKQIRQLIGELAQSADVRSFAILSYVRSYLSNPNCHVLIAKKQEEAVGIISYSIRPGLFHGAASCYIEELFVRREYRRGGIGGRLVKEVMGIAKRTKCAEITVSTEFENKTAAKFYRGLGMTDDGLLLEKHFKVARNHKKRSV